MVMGPGNDLPALVMVWVVPPEKVSVEELVKVTPEPLVQLPYTVD